MRICRLNNLMALKLVSNQHEKLRKTLITKIQFLDHYLKFRRINYWLCKHQASIKYYVQVANLKLDKREEQLKHG